MFPFCVCNKLEIHQQKKFNYTINIFLFFSKKLDEFYNDFKDKPKKIQKLLSLELFMC